MNYEPDNHSSIERLAGFIYRFVPAHDAAKSVESFLLFTARAATKTICCR
jgi:hypothetical protein